MTDDLRAVLASLDARLHPGVFVYCTSPVAGEARAIREALATFREDEGLTLILEESRALALGLSIRFRAAWITLGVNSQLEGVGLTAAVASALAKAGIACNVVAAIQHDHLFVPHERASQALQILHELAHETGAH